MLTNVYKVITYYDTYHVVHGRRDVGPGASGDDGVASLFSGVLLEDRRALRAMLAERRHVEERDLRADAAARGERAAAAAAAAR